jgi:hypothetical protein
MEQDPVKLTLQDLKAAMSPLAEIGKGELTFDVNGTGVSLRALTPDEELQVQRYARQALSDGDLSDQANALEYLDRFRLCSLGYSLVQVANLDFRGVEFVETGEKLPNGTAIKVRKHEAVQQLLASWSRNMTNAVFKKFGELTNRVEAEVEGVIEFDEVDYDADIARLEDRLRELRDAKNKMALSAKDPRTDLRKRVAASGRTLAPNPAPTAPEPEPIEELPTEGGEHDFVSPLSDVERVVVEPESVEPESDEPDSDEPESDDGENGDDVIEPVAPVEEPEPVPQAPPSITGRRASVFDRARGAVSPPVQVAPAPAPEPAPEAPPSITAKNSLDDVQDSFVNTSDEDSMEQAVAQENERLLARRAARSAPHVAARRAAEEVGFDALPPQPVLAGSKDGIDVYRMPTQTLTDRKSPSGQTVPREQPKPTANPKFRPVR